MVRRLLGTGHSVGILVQAGTPEGPSGAGGREPRPGGSRPAAAPAMSTAGEALWEGWEAEGWVCWQESLDAVPLDGEQSAASYSYGVLRQLGRAALNSAYVTLDDSRQTADVLPALLRQLNYRGVRGQYPRWRPSCEAGGSGPARSPSGDWARVAPPDPAP